LPGLGNDLTKSWVYKICLDGKVAVDFFPFVDG